ncbi:hypothetical protein [Pseudobdellovibrio exovorus]|uniref:Lipoprotein n=1 Tax=Pseudobdellovibrio exovorus JSS TaxID=1184267 RepID=M4V9A7_9BACT|nr:hypothetical protein [Pseudobdellovibrio exovorus]AGH95813.1 hypothetical protein A11Q_1597 [Pseudobdellovibrio exovorus JSS]
MSAKINLIFFALLTVFLSACSTVEFVRKDTAPTRQGVVRYYPTDDAEREAKYRADLNKKATEFCGGDFKITREYQALEEGRSSTGISTGFGVGAGAIFVGGSNRGSTMYNYVEFSCL